MKILKGKNIKVFLVNSENVVFSIFLLALILLLFISATFSREPSCEPDMFSSEEPLEFSNGLD